MNFGAALRCAHFLGAAGVLGCDRNAAPLSPVVSKASAGALEVIVLTSPNVDNCPQTLTYMCVYRGRQTLINAISHHLSPVVSKASAGTLAVIMIVIYKSRNALVWLLMDCRAQHCQNSTGIAYPLLAATAARAVTFSFSHILSKGYLWRVCRNDVH